MTTIVWEFWLSSLPQPTLALTPPTSLHSNFLQSSPSSFSTTLYHFFNESAGFELQVFRYGISTYITLRTIDLWARNESFLFSSSLLWQFLFSLPPGFCDPLRDFKVSRLSYPAVLELSDLHQLGLFFPFSVSPLTFNFPQDPTPILPSPFPTSLHLGRPPIPSFLCLPVLT